MRDLIKKNGLRILSAALILFAGAFAALPAIAEETGSVKLDIYNFDSTYQYPERTAEVMTLCASTYLPNIQGDWGGGDIMGCGYDFVAIHYTGTMTFESDAPVYLMAIADDGFSLSLDGVSVIEDWTLKGCSGSVNLFTPIAGHEYVLDAWFYEYGGGACSTLYSMPVDGSEPWSIVQPSVFVSAPVVIPEPTPEEVSPPVAEVTPEPEPMLTPDPEIQPQPQPEPEPTKEEPAPSPEPLPEPSVTPSEPTPAPRETIKPPLSPEEPQPITVVEQPSTEPPIVNEPILSQEQVIEQLVLAAEEDDVELPEELAAIPLLGNAAAAVLDAFNNLGNLGADMSPEVREDSEKVVVGAIIASQIAQVAASASVAASAPTRRNK